MPLHVSRGEDGVLTLRLDNPERRNALDLEMAAALRAALASGAEDPSVRCVVITGVGTSFCSGADLGGLIEQGGGNVLLRRELLGAYYRTFLDVRDFPVPTIAAVNGPAIGAGLNLALCCDLRLASPSARFGATFVRIGIHPGGGGTHLLTRLVGPARAAEMVLTGEIVEASAAVAMGLANRLVDSDAELEPAAASLAGQIASNAPAAVRASKRALRLAVDQSFEAVLEVEALAQAASQSTEDAVEGWTAFREKRPPRFSGR
jgi:enoyl-CoA hydratase/carnithine racemase